MIKYCQKCGKKFETEDPNNNFCYKCADEIRMEDKAWDEYFDNLEKIIANKENA